MEASVAAGAHLESRLLLCSSGSDSAWPISAAAAGDIEMRISGKTAVAAASVLAATISCVAAADLPVKALPPQEPSRTSPKADNDNDNSTNHSDQTDPGSVPLPTAILIAADGRY